MQDLLDLAFDDPDKAVREAERIVAVEADPTSRSYAHQCLGIVLREAGRAADSLAQLDAALRAAEETGRADRVNDVRATYGATLVVTGRTAAGLAHLARVAEDSTGAVAGKARMRWAQVLTSLGRPQDALPIMTEAVSELKLAGEQIWEARARNTLGYTALVLGEIEEAIREVVEAERIFRAEGVVLERLEAVENLGEIAVTRGDLPQGLAWFSEAAVGYSREGRPPKFELACARARALLSGGLTSEAAEVLADIDEDAITELRRADLLLLRAEVFLARVEPALALVQANEAQALYSAQNREWFELRARLVLVRARYALGDRRGLLREARTVAERLQVERGNEAPLALALAGRLASGEERVVLWLKAAPYRSRANGLVRAGAYLAGALERAESDDRGGVLRACASGLDAIDEHRRLMGSSELRALATTHGRELTELGLRHAAHDPRTLLRWSERTRATALAQPPATSDAATIPASLAALRDNGRRLAEARQAGEPAEDLERERLRLERAVRTESHTISADTDPQRPATVEEVVARVGDGCLVELVDVDGVLHVLVIHNGRVRRRIAGATSEMVELLGPASMLLRRAARGRPANTADIGRRLQEAILGEAARLIPDGPLTLAPTARLHGLAWALLPTFYDRPFSVVPSAGQWLRANEARRPHPRRTLLVAGPDLASGGAEVPILAKRHPDAVLLDGPKATVADVLEQLDGADLAHLATHGHFRGDSPLFSALDLADGPLTVYDLERLKRAPYRVVLSACESGVLAPVGAEELLGLAAALFSIGSAGLVSSVAEVNDAATADLMVGLHDALARGKDPAHALLEVRRAAADDPVAAGTAAAFIALGI